MASDPLAAYKTTRIETASKEQILLMLYEGAIKFMKQARSALEQKNYQLSHEKLLKAQDIVTELMASLDMDVGGEVAANLYNLYDFILHNLVQANVEKNVKRIDEALPIMKELQSAWDEVINKQGMTVEKARAEVRKNKLSGSSKSPSPLSQTPKKKSEPSAKKPPSKPEKKTDSDGPTYGEISFQG